MFQDDAGLFAEDLEKLRQLKSLIEGGQQGIYLYRDGSLQLLVDNNTTVAGSTIKFTDFRNPVVDGKNVAFVGGATANNLALGIYAKVGDSLLKVVDLQQFSGK